MSTRRRREGIFTVNYFKIVFVVFVFKFHKQLNYSHFKDYSFSWACRCTNNYRFIWNVTVTNKFRFQPDVVEFNDLFITFFTFKWYSIFNKSINSSANFYYSNITNHVYVTKWCLQFIINASAVFNKTKVRRLLMFFFLV